MRASFTGSLLLLMAAPFCTGQPAYVEVRLPRGVRSETMFVRYVTDDNFGGWVQPHPGVSSYFIAIRQGAPPARFRALLYAPGCAIQTVDLPTLGSAVPHYSFICDRLPSIGLTGTLTNLGHFNEREISIEARYVARWAQNVLGDGLITEIPIGGAQRAIASEDFQFSLPDLSSDPLAGRADHPGEFRILARDRTNGKIVAQLVPADESLRTRLGGLQIRGEYSKPVEFTLCGSPERRLRDSHGFSIRPDASDAVCER